MTKSATEVMQAIIFSAIIDAVEALKATSKGVHNTMLREIQTLHPNTTFGDLPKELQAAIGESTRAAFARLLKEGYSVGPRGEQQSSRPMDRVPERDRRPSPRPPGRGPGAGVRRGGRPPPKKPRG
ncbi:MAG: hypothetical protein M3438_09770 [Pseudomonadota bacterium]|nr:hypothetical protein [Sphingomonas sp.]MDQ3479425.1 hypothetical protein [Pseudomonadota bacterium]